MDAKLAEHNQHYAPTDGEVVVSAVLGVISKDPIPKVTDLAGLDQFHTGGLQATRTLAKLAGITSADRVLDVGGGIGGPARLLAQETNCQVTVVDLAETYCRIGEQLTDLVKLGHRVRFHQGNALDLTFPENSFDVVWTQHSTMNIPDKTRLYTQLHRVLHPGGRLAFQEVTALDGEPIRFPTMWAHHESMSFLMSSEALRATITQTGFRELVWNDITAWSLTWFQERQRTPSASGITSNGLGLQLLLGPDFGMMLRNHILNLQEGRIRIIEAVFERL